MTPRQRAVAMLKGNRRGYAARLAEVCNSWDPAVAAAAWEIRRRRESRRARRSAALYGSWAARYIRLGDTETAGLFAELAAKSAFLARPGLRPFDFRQSLALSSSHGSHRVGIRGRRHRL